MLFTHDTDFFSFSCFPFTIILLPFPHLWLQRYKCCGHRLVGEVGRGSVYVCYPCFVFLWWWWPAVQNVMNLAAPFPLLPFPSSSSLYSWSGPICCSSYCSFSLPLVPLHTLKLSFRCSYSIGMSSVQIGYYRNCFFFYCVKYNCHSRYTE